MTARELLAVKPGSVVVTAKGSFVVVSRPSISPEGPNGLGRIRYGAVSLAARVEGLTAAAVRERFGFESLRVWFRPSVVRGSEILEVRP